MKLRLIALTLIFVLFGPYAERVLAQPDARSILARIDSLQDLVQHESVKIDMRLFEDGEEVRRRELQLRTSTTDGERKALAIFTEPADIRGMSVLTLDSGTESDQRLYLPALRRIQRITGSQRKDRFAGSDLSFEDLRARDPDDYVSDLLETQTDSWVLSLKPIDEDSPYSVIEAVVDSDRFVITAARYFDQEGNLYKILESRDFQEVMPHVWHANTMIMRDVQENRHTELYYTDRDTATPIPADMFTERQLRRGI